MKRHGLASIGFGLFLVILPAIGCAEVGEKRPGLISSDQLPAKLADKNLRILDARGALSAYMQGHLPGAVFLAPETLRLSRIRRGLRLVQRHHIRNICPVTPLPRPP